jgi:ribosome-binding factor A
LEELVVSKARATRIAERMREEISEMMIMQIQDPRLSGISITDVHLDRELAFAEIYFSMLEGSSRAVEAQAALEHAQGYMRSELARRIELRVFPRLRFHWDPTSEKAEKIERLIATLHKEQENRTDKDS